MKCILDASTLPSTSHFDVKVFDWISNKEFQDGYLNVQSFLKIYTIRF